jgi:hypothetical protein
MSWGRQPAAASRLFVVSDGACEIGIDGQRWVTMGPLDAMCIAAGLVRKVRSFDSSYHLVELCSPGCRRHRCGGRARRHVHAIGSMS